MYAYARGVNSSREIERRCEIDLGFRYLAGGERPDHDTLCHFFTDPDSRIKETRDRIPSTRTVSHRMALWVRRRPSVRRTPSQPHAVDSD
ncbi:transposase [Stigmatella ashevillensis]|uniref:transposase n=1 Tax=Stigmatella ashevillensis TaxID=2995309 RepID=UPI00358DA20A